VEGEGKREVGKEREGGGRGVGKWEGEEIHFYALWKPLTSRISLAVNTGFNYTGHKVQLRADMLIYGEILGRHLLW